MDNLKAKIKPIECQGNSINICNLSTQEKGEIGEEIGRNFLEEEGFQIEDWNRTLPHSCSYDCIASYENESIYIEVRTSFTKTYKPKISKGKRNKLMKMREQGVKIWLIKIHYYPENPRIIFESFEDYLIRSGKD